MPKRWAATAPCTCTQKTHTCNLNQGRLSRLRLVHSVGLRRRATSFALTNGLTSCGALSGAATAARWPATQQSAGGHNCHLPRQGGVTGPAAGRPQGAMQAVAMLCKPTGSQITAFAPAGALRGLRGVPVSARATIPEVLQYSSLTTTVRKALLQNRNLSGGRLQQGPSNADLRPPCWQMQR